MDKKVILIIGAGRSSSELIRYLLRYAPTENWLIRVGDLDLAFAQAKLAGSPYGEAFVLNASDVEKRREAIAQSDLVISMLPATMHVAVAKDCIDLKKSVITPSYVADDMWPLDAAAKDAGILLLNEMGVDPGIDHMSAMRIIDEIKAKGGQLESFESFTGGLIAPESDNNPWNYKITWNPRNVVLAGYGGTARYQEANKLKFIPYGRLFERITDIEVAPYGHFEGYANRDSLKYKAIYGLENIPTLFRGTLRKQGFCAAWNALIQLGLTDDSFEIHFPKGYTWRELTASYLDEGSDESLENRVKEYLNLSNESMSKLAWLGLFDNKPIELEKGTPAQALQSLIEEKWALGKEDKDMLVMWHRFKYTLDGKKQEIQSSLVSIGEDTVYTAMARTVGLPIAIAARRILNGEWKMTGIHLPIISDIYNPVLSELESFGITFNDQHREL
jgi:saccharopine dehydrogenase (NAD+, L-glutamate forming)